MKAYLDKEKVLNDIFSDPKRKAEFLLAKFHEGEEVPDSSDGEVYDTTWMEDLDGLEVEIINELEIKITGERNSVIYETYITQPYKDAWITWK